jgi:5'-3' exonuclease
VIHIYDGNNVRLRAMTTTHLPGEQRLSLRQEYEKFQTVTADTHIWCWDGLHHNQRRKDIYPLYKGQREPMAEDMFSQIRLFKEILTHTRVFQVEIPDWEGDDVVGALARYYAGSGFQVTCHSNDLDYLQLETNPNIQINGIGKKPAEPRWVCLYKTLVGDSSDNIKGIPGFGDGAWTKLEDYWPDIERCIQTSNHAELTRIPFTKAVQAWIADIENLTLLRNMLTITHLFPIPFETLNEHIKQGVPNREEAQALLGKYFL